MTNLTFHRTQRAPSTCLRLAVNLPQGVQFNGITHFRTGAVGFNQFDGVGCHGRLLVSRVQGLNLPLGTGCVNGLAPPVTGGTDAFQYSINTVTVTLGICQSFEHDHPNAFPQNGPVSSRIKGPAITTW